MIIIDSYLKFFNYLKIHKESIRNNLNEIQKEINKYQEVLINSKNTQDSVFIKLHNKIYSNKEIFKIKESIRKLKEKQKNLVNELYFINVLEYSIIDNEQKEVIDNVARLFDTLTDAYKNGYLDILDISNIIGMCVTYNSNNQQKMSNLNTHRVLIIELAKYYNSDGSFSKNSKYYGQDRLRFLYNYLGDNNHQIVDKIIKLFNEHLDFKEYYDNRSLIKIPEDLDYFEYLLNTFRVSDEEKIYIYTLIDEAMRTKELALSNELKRIKKYRY